MSTRGKKGRIRKEEYKKNGEVCTKGFKTTVDSVYIFFFLLLYFFSFEVSLIRQIMWLFRLSVLSKISYLFFLLTKSFTESWNYIPFCKERNILISVCNQEMRSLCLCLFFVFLSWPTTDWMIFSYERGNCWEFARDRQMWEIRTHR